MSLSQPTIRELVIRKTAKPDRLELLRLFLKAVLAILGCPCK